MSKIYQHHSFGNMISYQNTTNITLLEKLRHKEHLSLRQLQEVTNVPFSSIREFECRKRHLPPEYAKRLGAYFKIEPSLLIEDINKKLFR